MEPLEPPGPRVHRHLTQAPLGQFTVEIPTEDGVVNELAVFYNSDLDAYLVQVGGGVVDESPEKLTAVLVMAMRAIQRER